MRLLQKFHNWLDELLYGKLQLRLENHRLKAKLDFREVEIKHLKRLLEFEQERVKRESARSDKWFRKYLDESTERFNKSLEVLEANNKMKEGGKDE